MKERQTEYHFVFSMFRVFVIVCFSSAIKNLNFISTGRIHLRDTRVSGQARQNDGLIQIFL
jgi:hypothetical protein